MGLGQQLRCRGDGERGSTEDGVCGVGEQGTFAQVRFFVSRFARGADERDSCGTPGPGHAIPFEIHDNLLASKVRLSHDPEADPDPVSQTYTGLTEGDSNPVAFIPFLIKVRWLIPAR